MTEGMEDDDVRNGARVTPSPSSRVCPHCLNPHTIVADERYRGLMRFCPMCDYSWVIGEVSQNDEAAAKRGSNHDK
jgi:hypothetical protein